MLLSTIDEQVTQIPIPTVTSPINEGQLFQLVKGAESHAYAHVTFHVRKIELFMSQHCVSNMKFCNGRPVPVKVVGKHNYQVLTLKN